MKTNYCISSNHGARGSSRRVGWFLLVILLLCRFGAWAQAPANDDAIGAILLPVTATCQPTAATNVGATVSPVNGYTNPGSCGIAGSPLDVWFRFVSPANDTKVMVAVGGNAAGQVRVFSTPPGSAGPFGEVACAASGATNTATPAFTAYNLQPGTVYYIRVAGYSSLDTTGPFTICVTNAPVCADPTNLAPASISNGVGTFTFTPGANNVSFAVNYTVNGGAPLGLAPTGSPFTISGLAPGAVVSVTLQATCANGGSSSPRNLTFIVPSGSNDEPSGAIPLAVTTTCVPTAGSNVGATGTTANGYTNNNAGGCGRVPTTSLKDVWFTFTTAASGAAATAVDLRLTNSFLEARVFSSANGAAGPFTSIGCIAGSNGTLPVTGLTPNTTYYVSVANNSGFGTTEGQFTICVTAPITCSDPTNVTVGNILSTSATLNFTPGIGNQTYTVVATPTAGGASVTVAPAPTASPIQVTGLAPNTAYTLTLQANCGTNGQGSILTRTFTTAAGAVANDFCTNALPIVCGQPVVGTTLGATSTGDPTAVCSTFVPGPNGQPSVWYSLTGAGQPVTLSMCSGPTGTVYIPTRLLVYTGSCAGLACVTGSSQLSTPGCSNSGAATVTFTAASGTTYYVLVQFDASAPAGPFGLQVTCPLAPCLPPTAVAVSPLSPTSASVSFTPALGGGAFSYSAVATPASGGPGIGVSGATSPLTLNGLLPNTAYTVTVTATCGGGTMAATTPVAFSTPLGARTAGLAAQVGLFPNPAHQSATLTVPAALLRTTSLLTLCDALGRTVRQRYVAPTAGVTAETRAELDLAGLPTGVYIVRLLSSAGPLTKRLVVE